MITFIEYLENDDYFGGFNNITEPTPQNFSSAMPEEIKWWTRNDLLTLKGLKNSTFRELWAILPRKQAIGDFWNRFSPEAKQNIIQAVKNK